MNWIFQRPPPFKGAPDTDGLKVLRFECNTDTGGIDNWTHLLTCIHLDQITK